MTGRETDMRTLQQVGMGKPEAASNYSEKGTAIKSQQAITQKKQQQLKKKQQQLRKKQQQLSHPSLLQTHPHLSKKATVMKSSRPVADSPSSKQKQNPRTSLTEARQTCYVTAILFPD